MNATRRKQVIPLTIVGVLLLALGIAALLLSRGKELNARHASFVFTESFDYTTGSFAAYTAWSERRVRAALEEGTDTDFVPGLLPFRLEPETACPASANGKRYRSGVVLTHDALDSAYMLQALGQHFQSRCFLVLGLLLPGHGSKPGELLNTSWGEWAAAEALAARELANEVEFAYLAGHGVGGTLALLEASRNAQMSGLILFAPQLEAPLSPWQASAAKLLGWMIPGARWVDTVPAYTPYRYEAQPWRLAGEVNALVAATQDAVANRQLEVPVLMVATTEDTEASTGAMLSFMGERVHPLSRTLLFSPNTFPAASNVQLRPSNTLISGGIHGVAHRGMTVPLYDANLGWSGASRDCTHYYRADKTSYQSCMDGGASVHGAVTEQNLQKGLLEGLQFNPFYADIPPLLDEFLGPAARVPEILKI